MCGEPDKQKATPEETALSQVAYQEWQIQKEFFQPLEDLYMDNVDQMGTETFKNSVANAAGNGVSANVAKQTGNGLTQAAMTGADPTSGRFKSGSKALSLAAGLNVGDAMVKGNINAETGYMQGMGNVVAMGQGESMQSQAGFRDLAMGATRDEMQRVQTSFDNKNDTLNATMKIGGAVATGYDWDKKPPPPQAEVIDNQSVYSQQSSNMYS